MNTTATRSPKLPVIAAASMLYSQSYKATQEDRAAMKAYADWKRGLGFTGPQEISLTVADARRPSVVLGWMTFTA